MVLLGRELLQAREVHQVASLLLAVDGLLKAPAVVAGSVGDVDAQADLGLLEQAQGAQGIGLHAGELSVGADEQLCDADGGLGRLDDRGRLLEAALPQVVGAADVARDGLAAGVHVAQLVEGLARGGECRGQRVAAVGGLRVGRAGAAVLVDVAEVDDGLVLSLIHI